MNSFIRRILPGGRDPIVTRQPLDLSHAREHAKRSSQNVNDLVSRTDALERKLFFIGEVFPDSPKRKPQ